MDTAATLRKMFPKVDYRIIRAMEMEGDDLQTSIDFLREEGHEEAATDETEFTDESNLYEEDGVDSMKSFEVSLERSQLEFDPVDAFPAEANDQVHEEVEAEQELDAEPLWSSAASSIYAVDSGAIEQFIAETNGLKDTVANAYQELLELKAEAAAVEKAAREAKLGVSNEAAGLLAKAAEVRETLVRAKEANETLAGEVYGEKAILGTEGKELCSRIHRVKDAGDALQDSVAECKLVLQARIEAAKLEILRAKEESLKTEEEAREILMLEEAALAEVVNESRKLDAETEACDMLREFLIEKGSVVDALEGEIAVLSEDVEVLKQKIDGLMVSEVYESFHTLNNANISVEGSYSNSFNPKAFDNGPQRTSVASVSSDEDTWDLMEA